VQGVAKNYTTKVSLQFWLQSLGITVLYWSDGKGGGGEG